jgi:hypothetical protein
MTDEQRAKVVAAHEAGHSRSTIALVVTGWGYPIKGNAVRVHFTRDCSCP